jgi:hypothetical protein
MTFEELCKLDSRIRTLHEAARVCTPRPDDSIPIWYDVFKPRVTSLVGWSRRRPPGKRAGCDHAVSDMMLLNFVNGKLRCHKCRHKHPKATDAELQTLPIWPLYTTEAYALVYDTIADTLDASSAPRSQELVEVLNQEGEQRSQQRLHATADRIADEFHLVGDDAGFVLDQIHDFARAEAESLASDFQIILADMRISQ